MSEARTLAQPMTVEEFWLWADRHPGRWELVDGEPRAMPPPGLPHGLIQARAAFLIERQIEATGSNCRVATETAVFPAMLKRINARVADLVVSCSEIDKDTIAFPAPMFILEILPPSNEQNTRSNIWPYSTIPSLRQILLLDATELRGEMYARDGNGAWPAEPARLSAFDTVTVEAVGLSCYLHEFYARTALAVS